MKWTKCKKWNRNKEKLNFWLNLFLWFRINYSSNWEWLCFDQSCVNRTETVYGTLRLFPVFISPIVWNMYGICVNIFNMNRYVSKSYTRSKNTIFRAGAAVVSTITSLQYIGETKRNLKDRFNEHRRPILNPTGNYYIHATVSEHFLHFPTIICFWFLLKNLKMGVILSGKQAKPPYPQS